MHLFVEHRLRLSTITTLFSVITSFSLSEERGFSSLVLRDFVRGVFLASFALAVYGSYEFV